MSISPRRQPDRAPPLRSHAERMIVLALTAPHLEIRTVRDLVAHLLPFIDADRLTTGLVGLCERGYVTFSGSGPETRLTPQEPALAWAAYTRTPRIRPELN